MKILRCRKYWVKNNFFFMENMVYVLFFPKAMENNSKISRLFFNMLLKTDVKLFPERK